MSTLTVLVQQQAASHHAQQCLDGLLHSRPVPKQHQPFIDAPHAYLVGLGFTNPTATLRATAAILAPIVLGLPKNTIFVNVKGWLVGSAGCLLGAQGAGARLPLPGAPFGHHLDAAAARKSRCSKHRGYRIGFTTPADALKKWPPTGKAVLAGGLPLEILCSRPTVGKPSVPRFQRCQRELSPGIEKLH